jgi:hypothetical protein
MKIQDFNRPAAAQAASEARSPDAGIETEDVSADSEDRTAVEMRLLRAQIEHLELVVETARSLMTSNQERLLRRLHDLPREMATLAARLDRLDHQGGSAAGAERARGSLRRVV